MNYVFGGAIAGLAVLWALFVSNKKPLDNRPVRSHPGLKLNIPPLVVFV